MRGGPGFGGEPAQKSRRVLCRGEEAAWAVKLVKVITGDEPRVTPTPDGGFRIRDTGRHLDALARYEELKEAIEE